MRKPRKLSHAESEVSRLKVLWRDQFPEAERDYWREQFASARSRGQLRQEMGEKHGLKLSQDVQLRRFCHWLADADLRAQEAEAAECDRAELEAQGLAGEQLRDQLLQRMKERALARADYKLGVRAVRLDLNAERLAIHQRRLQLDREQLDWQRANGKQQKEKAVSPRKPSGKLKGNSICDVSSSCSSVLRGRRSALWLKPQSESSLCQACVKPASK